MLKLDRIDRAILEELQRDGRLPITELAQRVGLSTSPCSERVRRLEREKVILGYHARVDPEALGRGLLVFVELTLSSKSSQTFEAVR
ncbi:MAG TPA: AsnC family transcriptional regulator, partial [Ottowia sp.]|nr:AsnC family transcriptional regulator [Ottowia sp.]